MKLNKGELSHIFNTSSVPDNFHLDTENISTDSRRIREGESFLALKGNSFDGNKFIDEAVRKGAFSVLCCETAVADNLHGNNVFVLRFKNDIKALYGVATANLSKNNATKLAITGSNGKTSTREILASLLSSKLKTLKPIHNFNNDIGVPLTLFKLKPEHEAIVVEIGMSAPGEIDRLGNLFKPKFSIITNVERAHLQYLKTIRNIAKAKCEIIIHTEDATIINADCDILTEEAKKSGRQLYQFSLIHKSDIFVKKILMETLNSSSFLFRCELTGEDIEVELPIPGHHNISNYLAAFLAATLSGMTSNEILNATADLKAFEGRYNIIRSGEITIIDDSYNANPDSMTAGISSFAKSAVGRKIALLGDMCELGEEEEKLHFETGHHISRAGINILIVFGPLAVHIGKGAQSMGMENVYSFLDYNKLMDYVKKILRPGDSLYVKASNKTGLGRVCHELKR